MPGFHSAQEEDAQRRGREVQGAELPQAVGTHRFCISSRGLMLAMLGRILHHSVQRTPQQLEVGVDRRHGLGPQRQFKQFAQCLACRLLCVAACGCESTQLPLLPFVAFLLLLSV